MTRELGRFTQFAVERLSDATYWMEEDARIIHANEAASRLVGYSVDELMAMRVYDLNVDLDRMRWPAIWALLKAEGTRTFEARHRRREGRVLEVEITAYFLELDGNEYSCAFVRDIGERKELEQRLRHAEKMEAIGRLAGGVAPSSTTRARSMSTARPGSERDSRSSCRSPAGPPSWTLGGRAENRWLVG